MKTRGFVIGLFVAGLLFGAGVVPAKAVLGVPAPAVPSAAQVQTLAGSLVPPPPVVIVPSVPDPNHPTFPLVIPAVPIAPGARPLFGVLSPTTVVTCQASYLGPLGAAVALTTVMDTLGQHPVAPGFLGPAFGPVLTLCTLAPYPTVSSCGPDATIQDTLADHPDVPALPGDVPAVDPFASVPAPFASSVVEIGAVQYDVEHYVYFDSAQLPLEHTVAKQLECS